MGLRQKSEISSPISGCRRERFLAFSKASQAMWGTC